MGRKLPAPSGDSNRARYPAGSPQATQRQCRVHAERGRPNHDAGENGTRQSMYVIWLPLKNAAITTTYALLQNKSVVVYEEMLRVIINYCETQNLYPYPTTILCDFELAVVRAVEQVLCQDAAIQGCFYHFTQATWRKIQALQDRCIFPSVLHQA